MKIVSRENGEEYEAVIERASDGDLRRIKRERKFGFDWTAYSGYDVHKLRLVGEKEILGLIAIREHLERGFKFVEGKLIELSKQNVGAGKKYKNIAGCLIAYACKIAVSNGCDGYVVIEPKTVLYDHYCKVYGFVPLDKNRLISYYENSQKLINEHLPDILGEK